LTLLVGENSSGKSSLLAIVACVFDAIRFPGNPGFNEPPYNLGTFDTIATHKGGRYGRDDYFCLGFSEGDPDTHAGTREIVATYKNDYGNVVLHKLAVSNRSGAIDLTVSEHRIKGTLSLSQKEGDGEDSFPIDLEMKEDAFPVSRSTVLLDLDYLTHLLIRSRIRPSKDSERMEMAVFRFLRSANLPFPNSFSFAPIRSKPRRTYDEFSEEYSPEGDHIPTLLARLLRGDEPSTEGQRVQQALLRFGTESGLFRQINVKRLGKKSGDPFQVQVAVAGPPANLTDVGYGVSQALPIIVQSVLKSTSRLLLLQQPEVHLHPRAQAALGSFFSGLAAANDRTFLIETHSDYLVDRVRQEVARGTLPADKVLILFFHKPRLETTVYPISLDTEGNVINAPECYRDFFLEEQINLFNRAESKG
jgi:energy-coupling factor transporter ATP-binding protein EcfA2